MRVLPSKRVNIKTTATIVTTGGALAAWLAGGVPANHSAAPLPFAQRSPAPTIDARTAALETEIGRLHDRLRPSTTPLAPGRNLFRFHAPAVAPSAAPAPPLPAPAIAPPPEPTAPAMRLIGIAEDPGADGPVRIAFISTGGQLFNVKEGETILGRYRIAKITSDVVELTDTIDGSIKRFALR